MKKWYIRIFASLILVVITSSCVSIKKTHFFEDPKLKRTPPAAPSLYLKASQELENQKWEDAIRDYNQFLRTEEVGNYYWVTQFNLARAYAGQKNNLKAIEQFRLVSTQQQALQMQALAYYEMSFVYESENQNANLLASLTDAFSRKVYLSSEVSQAELPARMASAYASLGEYDQAKKYYQIAENGIRNIKREFQSKDIPDWLPRSLYYMGEVSLRRNNFDDLENLLRPLERAQIYLLESAELNDPYWSVKSQNELIQTYQKTYESIANAPISKDLEIEKQRELQLLQWKKAQDFIEVMEPLINAKPISEVITPEGKKRVQEIYQAVANIKLKVQKILRQPRIGQELTPEAIELKRSRGQIK